MFCTHCGTKLPDDAKFCSSCGEKVPERPQVALQVEVPRAASSPYDNRKPIGLLDRYRAGVSYLDACRMFDEARFREFNRITGNRFSEADIQTQLQNAKYMIRGMEEVKEVLRSTTIESIGVFEEMERSGIDLSSLSA